MVTSTATYSTSRRSAAAGTAGTDTVRNRRLRSRPGYSKTVARASPSTFLRHRWRRRVDQHEAAEHVRSKPSNQRPAPSSTTCGCSNACGHSISSCLATKSSSSTSPSMNACRIRADRAWRTYALLDEQAFLLFARSTETARPLATITTTVVGYVLDGYHCD